MAPISRTLHAPDLDFDVLEQVVASWLRSEKLDVQVIRNERGGRVLQAKAKSSVKKLVGMASALNVELNYSDPGLEVVIGVGKWVDKAVVGGVVVVAHAVLWPIAIPAVIGVVKQRRLPERAMKVIEDYLASSRSGGVGSGKPPKDVGFGFAGRERVQRSTSVPRAARSTSHRDGAVDGALGSARQASHDPDEEFEVSSFNRRKARPEGSGSAPVSTNAPRAGKTCRSCGASVETGSLVCIKGHRQLA